MRKKIAMFIALLSVLAILVPGAAMAMTYNNDVPSGLTLLYWSVNPNQGGKTTSITFSYTGGFRAPMGIDAPFNSSWHLLDDVRPILLAEQEGFGNYLGGTNGSFGSNIKFSDNVLAAMKVQNFNPSQVGGANIPPSSTTLNSAQIAWLQKLGYSVPTLSQPSTPTPTPAPQTQTQSQPNPVAQQAVSTQTNTAPSTQSTSSPKTSSITSDPQVGKTVKSPTGAPTEQMTVDAKQFAINHPPSDNPMNIPIKIPANTQKSTSLLTRLLKNVWVWIGAGVVVLALAAIAGRIVYLKRRAA